MKVYIVLEEIDIDVDYGTVETTVFRNIFSSYYDVIRFIQSIPKEKNSDIFTKGGRGYFRTGSKDSFDKYDREKYGDGIKYLTDIQVCIEKKWVYRYFIILYKEI
jgi:hypothetical protein